MHSTVTAAGMHSLQPTFWDEPAQTVIIPPPEHKPTAETTTDSTTAEALGSLGSPSRNRKKKKKTKKFDMDDLTPKAFE